MNILSFLLTGPNWALSARWDIPGFRNEAFASEQFGALVEKQSEVLFKADYSTVLRLLPFATKTAVSKPRGHILIVAILNVNVVSLGVE